MNAIERFFWLCWFKEVSMDTLVYFGDAVKALGSGKVGGYLVRWGKPGDVDLEGDYFTPETDLGVEIGDRLPVYFEHGYDPVVKNRKIGKGTILKTDDIGLWFEGQLELRDEYERMIYALAEAGKLGWSSQAGGSLVSKSVGEGGKHIETWPLAEATLTKSPAEHRNTAVPIKSIYPDVSEEPAPETIHEEEIMAEEIKTSPPIDIEAIVKQAAAEAVKAYTDSQPKVRGGYDVEVTEDETDRSLKSKPFTAGEFFQAVKTAAMYPGQEEPRLSAFKATGLNEATPSQGGYLLPPQIASGIFQAMWGVGSVLSQFNPIRVTGNSLTINAIDETSRADGSRMGGVQGYWLAEAAQKTASKPKFRQIDLKLKKVAALCYATDELLADATALESWIANEVPNELRFKVEAAIINGDGVGKPLGILQSGALVSATRTDASEIDPYDVGRMWARRLPGFNDYAWFVNPAVYPQLLNMTIGQMPVYAPSVRPDVPYGTLLGRPVVENEYCPNLGTVGDILLASPSAYALITKAGVEAASSIHVKFDYDETCFRFVYRVDGAPYFNAAITAYDGSNTVSPFVALAAST
jgi:HK97 family phage major capsid protein